LLRSCQRISPGPRRFETFRNKLNFYGERLLALRPTSNIEDRPFSAVPDCLFNIFSQLHYVSGGLPSIRNLRTRHAAVTRDPPNMVVRLRMKNTVRRQDGHSSQCSNTLWTVLCRSTSCKERHVSWQETGTHWWWQIPHLSEIRPNG